MANIKNLSRIREIAESLPKLEDARKLLSQDESLAFVGIPKKTQPDGTAGKPHPERINAESI